MKIYILSDHSGLIGYYATKELACKAAENAYKFDLAFMPESAAETFQDYWDKECYLEVVDLEMEIEE